MAHEHAYLVCEDMCMVEGVPKNTYDAKVTEIEDDIDTIKESNPKCVDRYGAPTITDFTVTEQGWATGNIIVKGDWVVNSTGKIATHSGGWEIVTNSCLSHDSGKYSIDFAVDGVDITGSAGGHLNRWRSEEETYMNDYYFYIKFPQAQKISKFYTNYLAVANNATTKYEEGLKIYGSNDGTTWNLLQTSTIWAQDSNNARYYTYTIGNPNFYSYYKFEEQIGTNYSFECAEISTSEYWGDVQVTYNLLNFDYDIISYFTNMRILVDIPSSDTTFDDTHGTYININNLGRKLINQNITKGKKYELVYDGSAFNATEVVL